MTPLAERLARLLDRLGPPTGGLEIEAIALVESLRAMEIAEMVRVGQQRLGQQEDVTTTGVYNKWHA